MRMLSFEEFVIACEDDEPKTREEIEAKLNTLEQRGKELEEKKQDHLKKWDPYLDPNNKDVLRQNLSEEERKKVHELNEESLRLHEEIQDYNQERLRFQSYLMEWERNQRKNHLPVKPSEEEEISKLKKYGKYGLGVAAVGGLGYAGYKYLTRKKDSSNEGMLSFEGFVIALEDEKTDGRVWDILKKYDSLQKRIQDDPNHPESITSKNIIPKYAKEYKELTGRDIHKDWLSYKSILSKALVDEKAKKVFEEHPELKAGWFNDFKGKHAGKLMAVGALGLGGSAAYEAYKKKKRLKEEGKEEESKKHHPLLAALAGLVGGSIGSGILLQLDGNHIEVYPFLRKVGLRTGKDMKRFCNLVNDLGRGEHIHPEDARWIDSIMNKFKEHGEKELEALDKNTRLDRRLKDQLKEFIENTLKVAKQW